MPELTDNPTANRTDKEYRSMSATQAISPSIPQPVAIENDWFHVQTPNVTWLVDGLIPADGHTAVIGKAKAGKSSFIRSLIAAIVKNRNFLGRSIDIPANAGIVLYVHLDRKDIPWRVYKELRELGITQDDAQRLHIRTAEHLPKDSDFDIRLEWLKSETARLTPHLVVIDLMWQFAEVKNGNDYQAVLTCINKLQDALSGIAYQGALVVALHARKATNPDDEADDVIGSSAQRGSFVTGIYLTRDRNANHYTIMTDQTIRDDVYGEIDKSILIRNPDGTLTLGQPISDIVKRDKQDKSEVDFQRVLNFIATAPGCAMPDIMAYLHMSKNQVLTMLKRARGLVKTKGKGVKNDPFLYYAAMDATAHFNVTAKETIN